MNKIRQDYYHRDVDFDDLAARDQAWAAISAKAKAAKKIDFQDSEVVLHVSSPSQTSRSSR